MRLLLLVIFWAGAVSLAVKGQYLWAAALLAAPVVSIYLAGSSHGR